YEGLIYVPDSTLRMDILRDHHHAPLAGHCGIARTIALITRNYWFPGINAYVKDYVNSCYSRQQPKPPRHAATPHMENWHQSPYLRPHGRVYPAISSQICLFQTAWIQSLYLLIG